MFSTHLHHFCRALVIWHHGRGSILCNPWFGHIWPIVLKRLEPLIKINKFRYICLFFAKIEELKLRMVFFSKYLKFQVEKIGLSHQLPPLWLPPPCNIRGACLGRYQRRDYEKIGNDLTSMAFDIEWFDTFFIRV